MSPSPRPRRDGWRLIAVALAVLLLLIVVYPQLWIVRSAFTGVDGRFTLGHLSEFFARSKLVSALWHSLAISVATAAGALAIALPMAFVLARYQLPGRELILSAITMTTTSPPFLGAYAWVILLGGGGVLTRAAHRAGIPLPFTSIMGPGGIVWVGVWFTYALVFLLLYDAFRAIDPALDEASAASGARPLRTHLRISLPLVVPALATGFYLGAMQTFADFGTPRLIGGSFVTLPVLVYYEFLSEVQHSPALASAASMVMIGVSTAALVLQRRIVARRSFPVTGSRTRPFAPLPAAARIASLVGIWLVLIVSFVPHLVVVLTSFLTWKSGILFWQPTLDNYRRLLHGSLVPIAVSFGLAAVACAISLVLGVLIAYVVARRRFRVAGPLLNNLVMVPYVIPGTVFAIGLILAFNHGPLVLTGTAAILVIAFVARRLPYVMKSVETAMAQVHPAMEEAALSVGAPPRRAFLDVLLPMVRPALVSGGTVAFLQMITEISSTVMLYSVPWITMTVIIFTNALQPGSPFGVASAMTTVLMLAVYVPLYLVRRRYRTLAPDAVTP